MPLPAILAGLSSISSLLPLAESALAVLGAFKGTAVQAKTNTAVQDAIGVIGAVVPLVTQFGSGQEVTPDQVTASLGNADDKLADLQAEIARQKAANPDDADDKA